jgi:uncharacterized protein involved in exopolysaccharide biosynthesis
MEDKSKIDLVLIARKIWVKRLIFIKSISLFFAFGVFIAVISPRVYTARSIFIPQSSQGSKTSGSIGGLASLAGISLGNMEGANEVPPTLYPQFLSSTDFKKKLLQVSVTLPGTTNKVTYKDFYEDHYTPGLLELVIKYSLGLPREVLKLVQKKPELISVEDGEGEGFFQMTFEEFEHFKRLDGQLSVVNKDKEGVIELSFSMQDPLMAAELAQASETLLQEAVINYKIQNAQEQLEFTEARFKEKKQEFEDIQSKLAYFKDRNQNVISAALLNQQQKLEAEYDFAFSIYTELAKQLEQAKLQVAKDTPVFSVIQRVTIPVQKSSPNRPLIILIFIGLGLIVSLGVFVGKEILVSVRKDWSELN